MADPFKDITLKEFEETTKAIDTRKNIIETNPGDKVKAVRPGPIVTLFEIEPVAGTKAATINTISKDLARTMTVPSLRVVETVPGWTHDITNVGQDEMIVMIWANEIFDRDRPDTIECKV